MIYIYALFEELRNLVIHDIRGGGEDGGAMAITVYNSDQQTSRRQLIIDNCILYDCEPAWSEALTLNGNVEQFQVTNNRVYNMNNIAIDFIGMYLINFCYNLNRNSIDCFFLNRWRKLAGQSRGPIRPMCLRYRVEHPFSLRQ